MGVTVNDKERAVDVICQHTRNQDIIPIRLKIQDEDKVFQEYKIKGYKCLKKGLGVYMMPNNVYANASRWSFECQIEVFGTKKNIFLYYDSRDNLWTVGK